MSKDKNKKNFITAQIIFHYKDEVEMTVKKFLSSLGFGGKTRIIKKALLFYAAYADLSEEKEKHNVSFAPLIKAVKNNPSLVTKPKSNISVITTSKEASISAEEDITETELYSSENENNTTTSSVSGGVITSEQAEVIEKQAKEDISSTSNESETAKVKTGLQSDIKSKPNNIGSTALKKPKKPKTPSLVDFDDTETTMVSSKDEMLEEMLDDLGNF